MIGIDGVSHIGIVVPDLEAACGFFADKFGCVPGKPIDVPAQGLRLAYVDVGAVRIELLTPTVADSAVGRFLGRNPKGGLHHVAFFVDDAQTAAAAGRDAGLLVLGGGPAAGHHGRPLFFLHPKDTLGALFEIEQRAGTNSVTGE
jgi:methylmalonyl-CoA/ethylmalonyl-CoA epimerase